VYAVRRAERVIATIAWTIAAAWLSGWTVVLFSVASLAALVDEEGDQRA